MQPLFQRLQSALRALTMALLLLGVVVNPVLVYMGNLHQTEPATDSLVNDAHDHHQTASATGDSGNVEDRAADAWHALMHIGQVYGVSIAAFVVPMTAVIPQIHAVVPPPTAPLTSLQHIAGPFRPPIV